MKVAALPHISAKLLILRHDQPGDLCTPAPARNAATLGVEPIEPDVCAATYFPSNQPRAARQDFVHDPDCAAPRLADPDRCANRPPRGALRRGSMTTIGTPRFCAISALAQKCTLVRQVGAHETIRSLSSTAWIGSATGSMSAPRPSDRSTVSHTARRD